MIPLFTALLTVFFPIYAIVRQEQARPLKHPHFCCVGSFLCCGLAMIQEILTIRRRFFSGDIAGIEDTIDAVVLICFLLLAVAVLLNLLALGLTAGKGADDAKNGCRKQPD